MNEPTCHLSWFLLTPFSYNSPVRSVILSPQKGPVFSENALLYWIWRVEAMNRRAFLARVFTVAAAASTLALGPIPDFRKPLRACPYCGYKGNSVLGGRSANN